MKKVITVTAWIMFFFLLFLPAGRLLCSVVGYRLKLISYPVFAVIPALCGILELTLIFDHRRWFLDSWLMHGKCPRLFFAGTRPCSEIEREKDLHYCFNRIGRSRRVSLFYLPGVRKHRRGDGYPQCRFPDRFLPCFHY